MPNAFLRCGYHPCDRFTKRRAIQRCEDVTGCKLLVGYSAGIILNFRAPFGPMFAHQGASGPQNSIPDGLMPLTGGCESSGAHLGPIFDHFREKCEGFSNFCDFV